MLINLKEIVIGIIGGGVVGSATTKSWVEHVKEVKIYDIDPRKRTHELKETCSSDFVFICVPTPQLESGKCNTEIIENIFDKIDSLSIDNSAIFVLKSTIPIGFTRKLSLKYAKYTVLHSPEFLTARCSFIDAQIPTRNIIGVTHQTTIYATNQLANLYQERFPQTKNIIMDSNESEAVKLICNSFFAAKICFFNEMYLGLKDKINDWNTVMEGILGDGRISPSHTKVPGPDGKLGFGGTCLPKDIANLNTTINSGLLQMVIRLNEKHRGQ